MPPRWTNEEAVYKWVVERLAELRSEVERLDAIYDGRWPSSERTKELEAMHGLMMTEAYRMPPVEGELAACNAAKCGNPEPLVFLLQRYFGLVEGFGTVERLSPETCRLVIEFVSGERNPKTGKKKGELGRRKMSPDERRNRWPTHGAAELFPIIQEILRSAYPGVKTKDVRQRAIEFAAKKRVPRERLQKHLARSLSDRRRLDATSSMPRRRIARRP